MDWKRAVFGGAGPRMNYLRRNLIDEVKNNLEMWRDTNNPEYLAEAKRLLDTAE